MYFTRLFRSYAFQAFLLTFLFIGSTYPIITYDSLAFTKLMLSYIVLFIPIFLANFYTFKVLHTKPSFMFLILFSFLFSGALAYLLSEAYSLDSLEMYILIGDYLRDTHGINWYSMDYSGWIFSHLVYLTFLINGIFVVLADLVSNPRR